MLRALYLHIGTGGTLAVALLVTVSVLLWMPAVAQVTTSDLSWSRKLLLQLLLALFPPLAVVVLGAQAVGKRLQRHPRPSVSVAPAFARTRAHATSKRPVERMLPRAGLRRPPFNPGSDAQGRRMPAGAPPAACGSSPF